MRAVITAWIFIGAILVLAIVAGEAEGAQKPTVEEIMKGAIEFNDEFDKNVVCMEALRVMNNTDEPVEVEHIELYLAIGRYSCIKSLGMQMGCVLAIKKIKKFNPSVDGPTSQFEVMCGPARKKVKLEEVRNEQNKM